MHDTTHTTPKRKPINLNQHATVFDLGTSSLRFSRKILSLEARAIQILLIVEFLCNSNTSHSTVTYFKHRQP